MPAYLLLLHENPADWRELAPEEMQRVIEKYGAWSRALAERGQLAGGEKLRDDGGRHVRRNGAGAGGAALVTDGPYAEAREVVGGYFLVRADDYDAAVVIAGECPHLARGWVEVREIEPTP